LLLLGAIVADPAAGEEGSASKMDLYSLLAVFSFILGLMLGSFLNVCIYRIPLKESIVTPSSKCPHCGQAVRFYDNIPVLSFLFLRGKCRHCGHSISWRYPFVECLCGFLSFSLYIKYGVDIQYIVYIIFTLALVVVTFIDLDHKIIPDIISLPGVGVGIAVSFLPGTIFWFDSLIGAIAGGGILFLVAVGYERITGRDGMGGGDIKLLSMIGAWMGWKLLPMILLISSFSGALIGAVFIVFSGKGYRVQIPFGPFLSAGAVLCLFFGETILHWYLGLFV